MKALSVIRSWLFGDPQDRPLVQQMRSLWNVPEHWTIPPSSSKAITHRKVRAFQPKQGERRRA